MMAQSEIDVDGGRPERPLYVKIEMDAPEPAGRRIHPDCICFYDWRGVRVKLRFDCRVCAPDMAYVEYPWAIIPIGEMY